MRGVFNGVLVVVPHCSGHVPYDVATAMMGTQHVRSSDRQRLEAHHFFEADPYTDHLFHLPGATHINATVSRFVVDLNRMPSDTSTNGVVKEVDFDGQPLYPSDTTLDRAEQELRIRRYWAPFHAQIEELLSTGSIDLLVDAHSMKPHGPLVGPDHGRPRPAFTIGNLGDQHGQVPPRRGWVAIAPDVAAELARKLEAYAADLLEQWPAGVPRVTLNVPFAGGGTLQTYCNPQRQHAAPGLAIEINRALYLDSEGRPMWPEIDRLNDVMRSLVADALQLV